MKVTGAHTSQIAFGGRDVQEFGMNLQTFHAKDNVHAFFLHALAPLDVAFFVEPSQQLDDGRHLLAVLCCANQGLHHLGIFGQAIERGLDFLDFRAQGCFSQHANVAVERVVGNMDETVFLPDEVEDTFF